MAFTEPERVQIRSFMGATRLFLDQDNRLESAMDAVDAFPTSDTEDYITDTILVRLNAIDAELVKLETKYLAMSADEVKVSPAQAQGMLYRDGRRWVGRLADTLSMRPYRDTYTASPEAPSQRLGQITTPSHLFP